MAARVRVGDLSYCVSSREQKEQTHRPYSWLQAPALVAPRWLLLTAGGRGRRGACEAREMLQRLAGTARSSRCLPPLLPAVLTRAEQVASAGGWRLHTDELGPDLTEAGTFLEEEGFKKNAVHSWPSGGV